MKFLILFSSKEKKKVGIGQQPYRLSFVVQRYDKGLTKTFVTSIVEGGRGLMRRITCTLCMLVVISRVSDIVLLEYFQFRGYFYLQWSNTV